jgi:hypothetical protein
MLMEDDPTFDPTRDPIPGARKAIEEGGNISPEDVIFLAKALIHAHEKVDGLYEKIDKSAWGPQKLCDVANAANAYVRKHGAGDSPEGLALVEAVDAVWRNDA